MVEYPHGKLPFASFTFKYRSKKDLQIEGVIERSPSPVPLEERDPETLSAEEARELVRIQREQLKNRVAIKKEKREREEAEGSEDDGEVTMVSENRKRQKTSRDSGIEIVDLTNVDDDDDDE